MSKLAGCSAIALLLTASPAAEQGSGSYQRSAVSSQPSAVSSQLSAVSAQLSAVSHELPLVVERASAEWSDAANTAFIVYTVRNAGQKTIVAWGVQSVATYADGETKNGGIGTDTYDRVPVPGMRTARLAPGATHTTDRGGLQVQRRDGAIPVSVTARPSFVIYDDDTAAGDEREIAFQFRRRAENHVAYPLIEKALTEALAGDEATVMFNAVEALSRITDPTVKASFSYQSLSSRILHWAKHPGLQQPQDQRRMLEHTLKQVRDNRAAAAGHHERRY